MEQTNKKENPLKSLLGSEKLRLVGLGTASIGVGYYFCKQLISINREDKESQILTTLTKGSEKAQAEALDEIIKSNQKNREYFNEQFKTKLLPVLTKFLASTNFELGFLSAKIILNLVSNRVYCSKFIELFGIKSLLYAIQQNIPGINNFDLDYLIIVLKVLAKVIKIGKGRAAKKLSKAKGISLLVTLLHFEEASTCIQIYTLKCLTWAAEFVPRLPVLLNKFHVWPMLLRTVSSKKKQINLKVIEYTTSLINDCSKLQSTYHNQLLQAGVISILFDIVLEKNKADFQLKADFEKSKKEKEMKKNEKGKEKEKVKVNKNKKEEGEEQGKGKEIINNPSYQNILANSLISLTRFMKDSSICKFICSEYDIMFKIRDLFLSSNCSLLNFAGIRFIRIACEKSLANKIAVRETRMIPSIVRLLKGEKIGEVAIETICTIKILTQQAEKTENIQFFIQSGLLKEILKILNYIESEHKILLTKQQINLEKNIDKIDNKNIKLKSKIHHLSFLRSKVVEIIGNCSYLHETDRMKILNVGIIEILLNFFTNYNQDIKFQGILMCTLANLLKSPSIRKLVFKKQIFPIIVHYLNSDNFRIYTGAIFSIQNIVLLGAQLEKNLWIAMIDSLVKLDLVPILMKISSESTQEKQNQIVNILQRISVHPIARKQIGVN
ncbi:armadillo repeat-containing protein 4 armc4 [Anaeramoeba flamelloides]|uniref:Armadillo repeat-containing protein 4 armc4 n=1 Tax=Anaeramoeba flamelloides TaxID=1746091 RepID=A0AAV7ZGF1_9EUKA|nr:armadillo repeat-containing protein 4 armc4 [Anaeramoeba flamelloides]